jgi:GntR family transcriptional regulator
MKNSNTTGKGTALFIVISPSNPDPMYKQITDQIKDAIASRILKPNDKLPSIREMSVTLKISAITIKRAYSDLENEGYIITRSGLGSYVSDIDKDKLKSEKMDEIREEVRKLIESGKKFGISVEEIINTVKEVGKL